MLYPLLSVPVGIVRARDPVEAHGGPLPASLPRAYRTNLGVAKLGNRGTEMEGW